MSESIKSSKSIKLYERKQINQKYTKGFRIFLSYKNKIISSVNDIPTFPSSEKTLVNVVNEIPRFESAKFEISMKDPKNPIKQDIKKGNLRFYPNLFPLKGSMWNYGAIPQTWENPNEKDIFTQLKGDDDPIDILEIGSVKKEIGEVYQAKILGAIGLIDDGETDWKILAIDKRDILFDKINSSEDIEKFMPGLIKTTFFFLKNYKTVDGKPKNKFYKENEILSVEDTIKIIEHGHKSWKTDMPKNTEEEIIEETNETPEISEKIYGFSFLNN